MHSGCLCHLGDSNIWGGHAVHLEDGDDRSQFIGGRKRMCAAFYHGRWCAEIGVAKICVLDDDKRCPKNVCVGVGRLLDKDGAEKAVARYANCFRGSTHTNVHAESFVVGDKRLEALMRPGDTLVLYLSYQPCHRNGGGRYVRGHATSCSSMLCEWSSTRLAKLGVRLEVRCSDVFRAGWTDPGKFASEEDAALFHARCEAARDGVRMLHAAPNAAISGLKPEDWDFLWTLSDRALFTDEEVQKRAAFDVKIREFIASLRSTDRSTIPCMGSGSGAS